MSKVRVHISTSLDGYVAGPNESMEEPLGVGGEALHDWTVVLKAWRELQGMEGGEENVSDALVREETANVGAEIMGRGKFGPPTRGPWGDDPWRGWWGDDPPFHKPVFVLTHHEREPLTLSDTTFTFVTDGIHAALERAREAAGDRDVFIGGGAETINQYLAAGLVDELELHVVPMLLGGGRRLFDGVGPDLKLELLRTVAAPGVTHLKYRVRGLATAEVQRRPTSQDADRGEFPGGSERHTRRHTAHLDPAVIGPGSAGATHGRTMR